MGQAEPNVGEEDETTRALRELAPRMGRVAMALLGDGANVVPVLERVAREVGGGMPPAGVGMAAWILGKVRIACAVRTSALPLRPEIAGAPVTERMGLAEAKAARAELATIKPTEREAVVLMMVGGLSTAEVAAALELDLATTKARLQSGFAGLLRLKGDGR